MNDFLKKIAKSILVESAKTFVKRILKVDKEVNPVPKIGTQTQLKTHPWRKCPSGQHWVKTHPLKVQASSKNPDGITSREGHCAFNPKRNRETIVDYIEPDEIHFIAKKYFGTLTGPPKNDDLGFNNGNNYDQLIRGWTTYWNDIFQPKDLLDPNLVKALIGSESSFYLNPKPQNAGKDSMARGLIQLTDQAIKALSKPNNEIKDHYVKISKEETSDANMSIAAGIRWLFHKKRLASGKLGREATWEEVIAEYKGYTKEMIVNKHMKERGMIRIYDLYKRLLK